MLGVRDIPACFYDWNAKWRAPFGPDWAEALPFEEKLDSAEHVGPFAFQLNNTTREIEYPWAFHVAKVSQGLDVVEIGGALSGFQFVLARHGAHVTNVDPLVEFGPGTGYPEHPEVLHKRLNQAFNTDVRLVRATLPEAGLEAGSVDRAYCISTIEHLESEEIQRTLSELYRVLREGALFILTVDLFLNTAPFTRRERNQWGTNISIEWLVEQSNMKLVQGERSELCGFPEFDPERVLSNLEKYYVGLYPLLTQMLVLQK
jgi:SAM-dependent methyltransferase